MDKWIIDLNVKHKTVKCLEGNIGEHLGKLGFGNGFLPTAPILMINVFIISNITHHVQTCLNKNLRRI